MDKFDRNGVKFKYPERTCAECEKKNCRMFLVNGFDFAKYGCVHYFINK